ncbi:hypothetical protein [Candidatus Aquicultor secundus]|uniref:DUF1634 domain-containing protein n=1 Tax=Candidatus Aquicultor secundus TaxID=1973895 RepID=A0A2M7T8S1_9ACTN|nr:hypothetical protein [Candidatus Aquicultor secundus]NCO66424.1 hypothetical protein [Solirubrobacter sp.]PIX51819.1 MAG: hypothetical protein COZ51_07545 [Candidatus Aquicultor secundus]PIZ40338.1 MAG: hypothetical protein COY37_04130 [Candidatus Aquicultor secundus]PJB79951.1 MAG: hypothetical protein CO091_02025 [Candidatus Aquicultor secundus]
MATRMNSKRDLKIKPQAKAEPARTATKTVRATEEQLVYAGILSMGRKIGLAGIVASFLVYLSGILTPKMPLEKVPVYWHLSSSEYMKVAGIKPGWAWLTMFQNGDMLNFFGIAILGAISLVCYLAIIPKLLRKKDTTFAMIAIVEVLVLAFAASGIIHIGE